MAALTFSTMKTTVALNIGNLQTGDPWYTYLGSWINEASNRIILMAVDKEKRAANIFPDLRETVFTDTTVNAQNYINYPATCLVLDSMTYTKKTTAFNQSTDTEYAMTEETDAARFGQLSKTTTGWPAIWMRTGKTIVINPTPSNSPTNYLTTVVMRGIRREVDLVNPGDTLVMDAIWHPAVVDYATYLGMTARGWTDQAKAFLDACEQKVGMALSIVGLERRKNKARIQIAGMPGVR